MTSLYFSRIRLKKDTAVQAIAELLLPRDSKREILAARHKLIWSLFSDDEDRKRDFLWREDKYGLFYTLSARRPQSDMFDIESKDYAPALQSGHPLTFSLRANPVVSRKTAGQKRGQRHDVVMDRLIRLEGERSNMRNQCIQQAGADWLAKQAEHHGFTVQSVKAHSYHQHLLSRRDRAKSGNISTLDLEGLLTVTDSQKFLTKLTTGFGSAKAFGCGLMLIRRA